MEDFLFLNTRLEKGSLDKDKYGFFGKRERYVLLQTECKDRIGKTINASGERVVSIVNIVYENE